MGQHPPLPRTIEPGLAVAQVGRRHEVMQSCLYTWRKRFAEVAAAAVDRPLLIPVAVEDTAEPTDEVTAPATMPAPVGRVVITLPDGTRVEIEASYPPAALSALLGALRRR